MTSISQFKPLKLLQMPFIYSARLDRARELLWNHVSTHSLRAITNSAVTLNKNPAVLVKQQPAQVITAVTVNVPSQTKVSELLLGAVVEASSCQFLRSANKMINPQEDTLAKALASFRLPDNSNQPAAQQAKSHLPVKSTLIKNIQDNPLFQIMADQADHPCSSPGTTHLERAIRKNHVFLHHNSPKNTANVYGTGQKAL